MHSSTRSPTCRLDWRPSRQEQAAVLALLLLAAFSLLSCDLPRVFAWPGAGLILVLGVLSIRRSARRRGYTLVFTRALADCRVADQPVVKLELRWRGVLLFVRWKHSGQRRWRHAVFWPDTLTARQRRELRLVAPVCAPQSGRR